MSPLVAGILLLLSCAGEHADSGGASSARVADCERDPPLTYDNFGKGFMDTHCAGCHSSLYPADMREGAPLGVDLDTYQGVLDWHARIDARALSAEPDMPPGGGPGEEELDRLAEWLQCRVADDLAALGEGE